MSAGRSHRRPPDPTRTGPAAVPARATAPAAWPAHPVCEDAPQRRPFRHEGKDPHGVTAACTNQRQHVVDPGQQHRPGVALGAGCRWRLGRWRRQFVGQFHPCRRLPQLAGQGLARSRRGDHRRSQARVRRQDAEIADAMAPGRRDQRRQAGQQLQGGVSVGVRSTVIVGLRSPPSARRASRRWSHQPESRGAPARPAHAAAPAPAPGRCRII